MKVYDLKLKVFLLEDITLNESREKLCELIDKSLAKEKDMMNFHKENNYKFYVFNNLYPIQKDKLYKQGNIYTVIIRTLNEKLVDYFKEHLLNEYTESLKSLTIECKIIPKKHIDKIYTITPVIEKFENGYWKDNFTLDVFEKRLKENLIKKYNKFNNSKINEDFQMFNHIKLENRGPVPCKYKNIILLGDKVTLSVAENE